jgi:predicted O-methyltransferase YrrM
MSKELELLKEVCAQSFIELNEGGATRTKSPELTLSAMSSDLIDLGAYLKEQRDFERQHCGHILCGDTGKSCVIIGLALRLFKPQVVYEIGRYRGWSTAQMAFNLRHNFNETGHKAKFISIDPHVGADGGDGWSVGLSPRGKQCGGLTEWDISRNNLLRAGISDFVTPIKAFSATWVQTVDDAIDFIFIDGDHTYNGAKVDVEEYGKKMVSGGICIIHDVWGENFTGNANYGPSRVYAEADANKWEKIGITWNVGILKRR